MGNTKNNLVVYSEGEAILASDLMNMQLFERAFQLDILGAGDYRKQGVGTLLDTAYGFTKGPGAYLYADGTNLTIHCAAGTLIQRVGTIDGATPATYVYSLDSDEVTFTAPTPDPTNDRWLGIYFKLTLDDTTTGSSETRDFEDAVTRAASSQTTFKKRRVVLNTTTVLGAVAGGAGTNPALPATPVGYVPWGYVLLNAGFTTVAYTGVTCNLVPCGYRSIFLPARDLAPGTNWAPNSGALVAGASPGTQDFLIPIGQTERVMQIEGHYTVGGGSAALQVGVLPLTTNSVVLTNYFPYATQRSFNGSSVKDFYGLVNDNPPLWGDGTWNAGAYIQNNGARFYLVVRYTPGAAGDVLKGITVHVCGR